MEAFKFIREFNRMCNYYSGTLCKGCPREKCSNCDGSTMNDKELMELISDVERWSKEHPKKTRLQDFLEKYPNALMKQGDYPRSCAKDLGYCEECPYINGLFCDCNGCWNMPVEDDE